MSMKPEHWIPNQKKLIMSASLISPGRMVGLSLIVCFFLIPDLSVAQETIKPNPFENHYRIGIGLDYIFTVDNKVSPHLYRSLRKNVHFGYENRLQKGIYFANFNVFLGDLVADDGISRKIHYEETDIFGNVKKDFHELNISQFGLRLEIGYLRRLSNLNHKKAIFHLGGSLSENFTFVPGHAGIGTINTASLSAKVTADYYFSNGKPLSFSLGLPIISLVTRLPYHNIPVYPDKGNLASFFTGNNNPETLNKYQNIQFSVKYHWLITNKLSLDVSYMLNWMHYYNTQHFTHLGNQLSLGINF